LVEDCSTSCGLFRKTRRLPASEPSHSFQCSNSWFFLSLHEEGEKLYELDMERIKWAQVTEMTLHAQSTSDSFRIVSDGNERAYRFGGCEPLFSSPIQDVLAFDSSVKRNRQWNLVRTAGAFRFYHQHEHPGLEYCELVEEQQQPLLMSNKKRSANNDSNVVEEDEEEARSSSSSRNCRRPCLLTFCDLNGICCFDIQSRSWSKLHSIVHPKIRGKSTLVYLASQQRLLMYGGATLDALWKWSTCDLTFDDLWTFDLSKERRGWQRVYATGTAPENCNNNSSNTARTKSVVVIKGSEPKMLVLQESDTAMTRKEIVFYFLDCLTLHWTRFNSHIQMELIFASIFQPKYSSSLDGNQCYLYMASPHGHQRIYYIFLKNNEMTQRLYHASLQGHLCDIVIAFD